MAKKCSKCEDVHPLSFYKYKNSSGNYSHRSVCKFCRRKQINITKKQIYQRDIDRHREKKRQMIDFLGGSCMMCGGTFHPVCYDFHHIKGQEKTDAPTRLLRMSWERVKKELGSCLLLCSNCHRLVHWQYDEGGD